MIKLRRYEVRDHAKFQLDDIDPDDTNGIKDREQGDVLLHNMKRQLIELQQRLYASNDYGLLLVLQALDAGGKDGTIRSVLSGVNPQGVHVSSFKSPSAVEAAHDYLWRIHHSSPARGRFVIFNRSHYEDVVVVRVHKDQLVPAWARGHKHLWEERYEQINNFERHLTQNNILVVKCFLHISKDEQKRRLEKRLADPKKNWKFSAADLAEREHWDEYHQAFEQAFRATGTQCAPWYIIPANKKWYRNAVIAQLLVEKLRALRLKYPKADPEALAKIKIK